MQSEKTTHKRTQARLRSAWRARVCAASLCAGVQVFLLGTGIAMRVSLNSAWLAALCAPPVCALCAAICARAHRQGRALSRAAGVLLASALLLCAALSLGALVCLAEQSLLRRARTVFGVFFAWLSALLCALGGGTGIARLCFALRFLLPGAAAALAARSLPLRSLSGIFPILGPGAASLLLSALCMLSCISPVLMLLLPPPEIMEKDAEARRAWLPDGCFFAWRVFAGAAFGALILFVLCGCSTYASLSGMSVWGDRLAMLSSGQPHAGIVQALLASLQMAALLLHGACMLSCAGAALRPVLSRFSSAYPGVLLCAALLLCMLVLPVVFGFSPLVLLSPAAGLPAALCLFLFCRRKGDNP